MMKNNKVLIKEIFKSIQGEGIYVGVNQAFVRFSRCNLNCAYCDTDFKSDLKEYSAVELAEILNKFKNIHSISLTGGEPLIETDFLLTFLPLLKHKVYLETNGTLYNSLKKIINFIDIISMDIKLPSCSESGDLFFEHEEFIKIAKGKDLFIKIVFDENIIEEEIIKSCNLASKYSVPIILQPKNDKNISKLNTEFLLKTFDKFTDLYLNIRLIPQVHRYLDIA